MRANFNFGIRPTQLPQPQKIVTAVAIIAAVYFAAQYFQLKFVPQMHFNWNLNRGSLMPNIWFSFALRNTR